MEEVFAGKNNFSMKVMPGFPALFKNRSEIKFKKTSFQLKVRSNIKT